MTRGSVQTNDIISPWRRLHYFNSHKSYNCLAVYSNIGFELVLSIPPRSRSDMPFIKDTLSPPQKSRTKYAQHIPHPDSDKSPNLFASLIFVPYLYELLLGSISNGSVVCSQDLYNTQNSGWQSYSKSCVIRGDPFTLHRKKRNIRIQTQWPGKITRPLRLITIDVNVTIQESYLYFAKNLLSQVYHRTATMIL